MTIDWWTLGLQAVNLLVLLWILSRFLFRPIADMIANRQREVDAMLDDASAAKREAAETREQAQAERKQIAAEHAALADTAQAEAERQRAAILASAQTEAEAKLAEAKADIARKAEAEEKRLHHAANMLATDIAERLLREPAQTLSPLAFVDRLAAGIASLDTAEREALATSTRPAVLTLSQAVGDDELAQIKAAIEKAAGHTIALTTTVSGQLVAGLRLDGGRVVVDANLAVDMARVSEKLDRNDG